MCVWDDYEKYQAITVIQTVAEYEDIDVRYPRLNYQENLKEKNNISLIE
jgi:hypothetical protein